MKDDNAKAVAVFDKHAQDYENKFMDTGMYHRTFDRFCAHIETIGADVLDLACGPGNITRYLLDKRPDFRLLGTDLAPNMIALAQKNNPEAEFQIMDCRKVGTLERQYHGIMCGFILPYLSKEESLDLIRDAATRLLPGGVLYLSTMEDDYSKSGIQTNSHGDQVMSYFHEAGYLTQALTDNHLEPVHTERFTYPGRGDTIVTDLVIIGVKRRYEV